MIEIIENGTDEKRVKTCDNCGCKFVFNVLEDTISVGWSMSLGEHGTELRGVRCPVCGERIIVYREKEETQAK